MHLDYEKIIGDDYRAFELAGNNHYILPRLESRLTEIYGEQVKLSNLSIPRVFPQRDGSIYIQYRLIINKPNNDRANEYYFYGILLHDVDNRPEWAMESNPDILIYDDLNLIVPVFPYDPKLKLLNEIDNLPGNTELSNKMLGERYKNYRILELTPLAYRFGRRAVFELSVRNRSNGSELDLILKLFRPGKLNKKIAKLNWLNSNWANSDSREYLNIPEVVNWDDELGLVLMEKAPGVNQYSLIGTGSFIDSCEFAAKILSKLHSIDANLPDEYKVSDEIRILNRNLKMINQIFPEAFKPISEMLNILSEKIIDDISGNEQTPVHRDFYDKQIMFDCGRTTLLDCDSLTTADPAIDYGNYMAHNILRQLQFPQFKNLIKVGGELFEKNYVTQNTGFFMRKNWWVASTLLRFSMMYLLRPRWRHLSQNLLSDAGNIIKTI